jgi:hypothetical protein
MENNDERGKGGGEDPRDIEGMTWAQMMHGTGYSEVSAMAMRASILEQRRFDAHLFAEPDDLGAIIRGLLYVENSLRKILTEGPVSNPEALQLDKAGARHLANVALALGLIPEQTARCVKRLVKIRDEFAHQLDRELTREEVDAFVVSIPGRNVDNHRRFLQIAAGERRLDGLLDFHLQMRVAIQTLRSELNACAWDNFFARNAGIMQSRDDNGAAG